MHWTDRDLGRYGRFVLQRRVRAIELPMGRMCACAMVHPFFPVIFYSGPMKRSFVWHECGHIRAAENARVIRETLPNGDSVWSAPHEALLAVPLPNINVVEEERKAHTWAVLEARRRGFLSLVDELIRDLDDWEDIDGFVHENRTWEHDIYTEARRLILQDIG